MRNKIYNVLHNCDLKCKLPELQIKYNYKKKVIERELHRAFVNQKINSNNDKVLNKNVK